MTTNLKIEHVRKLMDALHERNRKDRETIDRLCALLTELVQEHGEARGADAAVVAAVIEPKD